MTGAERTGSREPSDAWGLAKPMAPGWGVRSRHSGDVTCDGTVPRKSGCEAEGKDRKKKSFFGHSCDMAPQANGSVQFAHVAGLPVGPWPLVNSSEPLRMRAGGYRAATDQ